MTHGRESSGADEEVISDAELEEASGGTNTSKKGVDGRIMGEEFPSLGDGEVGISNDENSWGT